EEVKRTSTKQKEKTRPVTLNRHIDDNSEGSAGSDDDTAHDSRVGARSRPKRTHNRSPDLPVSTAPKRSKRAQDVIDNFNKAPGNRKMEEFASEIWTKYRCNHPGKCPHGSTYCIDHLEAHMALRPQHIQMWATKHLAFPETVDIDHPPNDPLFDPKSQKESPLLERRKQLMKEAAGGDRSLGNFTIVNNIPALGAANQDAGLQPLPARLEPAQPMRIDPRKDEFLLPRGRKAGLPMMLHQFCFQFDLADDILTCLTQAGYRNTGSLGFVELLTLPELGPKSGHIASLYAAVDQWAVTDEADV
ncbi:hypothetical protein K488DRAFT_75386, partial [Vararia minispora EC-137]